MLVAMLSLQDFEYTLPEERIAVHPPAKRGSSRLLKLHRDSGAIEDKSYADIVDILQAGDVLVINDTKVIKARLHAEKLTGGGRELILLEQHGKQFDTHHHMVMYRGKLKVGDELQVGSTKLRVKEVIGGGLAKISTDGDLLQLAQQSGSVPLPPYMHREAEADDETRYQTVWAQQQGSVAAPTASLNMTEEFLDKLQAKGVIIQKLTLHVGLGTFMPIRIDDVSKHKMHQEYFEVPAETVAAIHNAKNEGRRIIALGTTVARTLEYCADKFVGEPQKSLSGEADIFIYPGYEFKVIDGLLTNFHAPHSTVLMLAAAFAGWPQLKNAYEHAISKEYNFLSYGDSMLIL